MPDRLPFNRWAIVEAAYVFAEWLPPEQGEPIHQRLKRIGFKPSLSVTQAGECAYQGESVRPPLDRVDYADTRDRLARHLARWRTMTLCEGCYHYVPEVVTVHCHRADPENGPSPHDHWDEQYCPQCHAGLTCVA